MIRMREKKISDKALALLKLLNAFGVAEKVKTFTISQEELAQKLNITRQALSIHLRELKNAGLIRTGRKFIDITEKGIAFLEGKDNFAFVFIQVSPKFRNIVYDKLKKLDADNIYRITGDIDIIAIVKKEKLDDFLKDVNSIIGINNTKTHIILEKLK